MAMCTRVLRLLLIVAFVFASWLAPAAVTEADVIYCGAICLPMGGRAVCHIDTYYCPNGCRLTPQCYNTQCVVCGMSLDPWAQYSK
jgi:hypothetical protein